MTHEPAKSSTLQAVQYAKEKGLVVSYDPNLRAALWESLEQVKEVILEGIGYADVLKISEEELLFLTGTEDLSKRSKLLVELYQIIQRNKNLAGYEVEDIEDSIRFAIAVGALAATKRGAIDVMPTFEEIALLMK